VTDKQDVADVLRVVRLHGVNLRSAATVGGPS
jgi:hypothetical protein